MFSQSDPKAPPKMKYKETEVTLWDRIHVRLGKDITLAQLVDFLEEKEGIDVDMVAVGASLLYFNWMTAAKRKERMNRPLRGT
tara:strand:+ start:300 stop:548 length:249 start_codon:yes stop_codon:yes gene_type:complete